jgi:hypothetical protein
MKSDKQLLMEGWRFGQLGSGRICLRLSPKNFGAIVRLYQTYQCTLMPTKCGLAPDAQRERLRYCKESTRKTVFALDGTSLEIPHTRTIATKDEIALIAPEIMGWTFVEGMVEEGAVPIEIQRAYESAGRAASDKLTAGLSANELLTWLRAARDRYSDGIAYTRECALLKMAIADLEAICPTNVATADWQQAITDGRQFLTHWGEQAQRLGWTQGDLIGRRRSIDDNTGLIWSLRGRPVVNLFAERAVIGTPEGPVMFYRDVFHD